MRILHGLCQGNGAVPAGWLALSSFLVTVYKNLGYDKDGITYHEGVARCYGGTLYG